VDKHLGQKISMFFAILSYIAGVACIYLAATFDSPDSNHPIRAAYMASVVFFFGCGIVLHVIGTARLKGIISGKGSEMEQQQD